MNINKFAQKISRKEAGGREIDIAQIKEILYVIDCLTGGALYAIIRLMK